MKKTILITLVICLAGFGMAQTRSMIQRFAPKGSITANIGDDIAPLMAVIANRNRAIAAHYDRLAPQWRSGVTVLSMRTVDDGDAFIDNTGLINGRVVTVDTTQRGSDVIYKVKIDATGQIVEIKTCGQTVGIPPPPDQPKPKTPFVETDRPELVAQDSAEAEAEATANSESVAYGGSASAMSIFNNNVPKPPAGNRLLSRSEQKVYNTGGWTKAPQTSNKNIQFQNQQQQQQQEQWMEQWMQQFQELILTIKN